MSSESWIGTTVRQLAAPVPNALVGGPFGSNLVSADYVLSGVPVIRGHNVGLGRWIGGDFAFVSDVKADALSSNIARAGDLVFTQRGTLGQVAVVPSMAHGRYVVSQSQMKLTPDPSKADVLFLYYVFISSAQQDYIRQNAIQTGVPHTNLGILRDTPLRLPPIEEQRRIAGVLGVLDDKIELNDQACRELEALGALAFEEHVGRFLDAGASAEPLSQIFEIGPPRRLASGSTAPYLEMKNMPTEGHHPLTWTQRKAGSGARFTNGDTLMARITPCLENGKAAFVDFLRDAEVGWGSTEYVVLRPRPPIPLEFAYFLVRHDHFRGYAVRHMTGTSGRQRVSAAEIGLYKVRVPDETVLLELGSVLSGALAAIASRREENRTLASIRDALLPKLVCGEIRVPEDYEPSGLKSAA